MKVSDSTRLSIDDWVRGELKAAMLHACNAVDGTARKVHSNLRNRERFTRILRENFQILGPMGMPGIDLVKTRFPVTLKNPTTADGKPDVADVIYGIHRCTHAHGDELPDGFELHPDASGPSQYTRIQIRRGKVRMSDRMIFGLLAVAVLTPSNKDQAIPGLDGYFLTYGASPRLPINEWRGRASDFAAIVAQERLPQVALDFGDWSAD